MRERGVTARALITGALVAGLVTVTAGCTSPTSPTVHGEFTKIDLTVGTGAEAVVGSTVVIKYTGYLYDNTKSDKKGAQFDATPAGQPFVFKLGGAQVVQGFDLGVQGMKVGGLRRVIIPSEMAYGREGAGDKIPPNATLVFELELLSVATQ